MMSSSPLVNMAITFVAIGLMFLSVILTIFSREKLKGFLRYALLTVSFCFIVVAGFIVLLTVLAGPSSGG